LSILLLLVVAAVDTNTAEVVVQEDLKLAQV
jgi:hypothetical protein